MQRILQINIAGRVLPIEEDAYNMLKDYIISLERQFTGDDGKEILEDLENRIAELFSIRLQGGAPAIDRADVQKVMDTLGAASDLGDASTASNATSSSSSTYGNNQQWSRQQGSNTNWQYGGNRGYQRGQQRLLRNPFDKVVGGVCSGLARYFDVDPVIVRLVWVVLLLVFGIGFLAYLIAWAVIPAARSMAELEGGEPMTFHDVSRNMQEELEDLKRRGEQMSRELRDFFSKKK